MLGHCPYYCLVERLTRSKERDNSGMLVETRHDIQDNDEDEASNPITTLLELLFRNVHPLIP